MARHFSIVYSLPHHPSVKTIFQVPASDRFPAGLAFESSSLLIMRIASLLFLDCILNFLKEMVRHFNIVSLLPHHPNVMFNL